METEKVVISKLEKGQVVIGKITHYDASEEIVGIGWGYSYEMKTENVVGEVESIGKMSSPMSSRNNRENMRYYLVKLTNGEQFHITNRSKLIILVK